MHIFTYGTLMAPMVWGRVVAGDYKSARGDISGFKRLAVAGETYPGLIEAPGHQVDGVVYLDVADQDLARLDRFEGEEYERSKVVALLAAGRTLTCCTYLFREKYRHRLTGLEWSFDEFVKTGIKDFMAGYSGWKKS